MKSIIFASVKTLTKTQNLIKSVSDYQFTNSEIPPYCSSIGSHVRHILDFYNCIFQGLDGRLINLSARTRSREIEGSKDKALAYCLRMISELKGLIDADPAMKLNVIDDLGNGPENMDYTLVAVISQANSHTIHHHAIINYLLHAMGVESADLSFGLNPTTPKPDLDLSSGD